MAAVGQRKALGEKPLADDAVYGSRIKTSQEPELGSQHTITHRGGMSWVPKAMLQSSSRKWGQLITGITSRQAAAQANELSIDL